MTDKEYDFRSLQPNEFGFLNKLATHVYRVAASKGFHDDEVEGDLGRYCANLHGEVSELWEAYRKNKLRAPCDKDLSLTCAEEELADIIIRACDTAASLGIDLGRAVHLKDAYNQKRSFRHGGKKA